MTTVAHGSELRRPGRGGLAARRPLIRWAWRLFRREWRQQILVIALLTVAVTAAVTSVTIAYNSGPLDYAEFGSANALFELDGADPRKLEASLAAAEERFGTTDVIGHRTLPVPGSVDTVEFRAQDPRGPYVGLALRRGSYPEGPGQVAVTDGVATLLGLEIGKTLALDGRRRTVVGIVENPRELSDEFALVSPSSAGAPDTVTVLVDADSAATDAFIDAQADRSAMVGARRRGSYQPAPELAMFSVATVFMLLASLVAAAGFAVIAQRRLRQLGMLAAIGATEKHLRLVLLTNGAVVGAVGALIGTIAGLALWVAVEPTLEPALDFRLDRLSLPWALLAMIAVVAVLCATAAAWWPGRAVARVPVTRALSARPPRPKPARHSAILAVVLIAAGIGSLVLSTETHRCSSSPGSWRRSSARCSWVRWRFASSPGRRGTPRSPFAWRCETSPATKPVPGRHSRPSPLPSASPRRSSSSRRPRRGSQPANRPTCPTGRSACTPVQRRDRRSSRSRRRASSNEWLLASAGSRRISMTRPSSRSTTPTNRANRLGRKAACAPFALRPSYGRSPTPKTSQGRSFARPHHRVATSTNRASTSPPPPCSGTSESTRPRSNRTRTS